jgi:hypothetical protein
MHVQTRLCAIGLVNHRFGFCEPHRIDCAAHDRASMRCSSRVVQSLALRSMIGIILSASIAGMPASDVSLSEITAVISAVICNPKRTGRNRLIPLRTSQTVYFLKGRPDKSF